MKQALISPNEPVYDFAGNPLGDRVAQVAWVVFPVAAPLFWVTCDDDVVADQFYWFQGAVLPVPPPPPPPPVVLPDGGGPAVL